MQLQFGLGSAVPDSVTTAWGARWIYPGDMLWDRQSAVGPGTEFNSLKKWLDTVIGEAREQAIYLDKSGWISPDSSELFILHKDGTGIIVANPNRSFGYLYVAAWLHDRDPAKWPPPFTPNFTHKGNNKPKRSARVRR